MLFVFRCFNVVHISLNYFNYYHIIHVSPFVINYIIQLHLHKTFGMSSSAVNLSFVFHLSFFLLIHSFCSISFCDFTLSAHIPWLSQWEFLGVYNVLQTQFVFAFFRCLRIRVIQTSSKLNFVLRIWDHTGQLHLKLTLGSIYLYKITWKLTYSSFIPSHV